VKNTPLRKYHAAVWDEPLVMQMGSPGRRGGIPPVTEEKIRVAVGNGETFVPVSMRRKEKLDLPEPSPIATDLGNDGYQLVWNVHHEI
jgi:glycine dehydrogenase subunit 2